MTLPRHSDKSPQSQSTHSFPQSILVLGGSGLIGSTICKHFGRNHWHVGIHYCTNKHHAEETGREIQTHGGKAVAYYADVREFQKVNNLVGNFVAQVGHLNTIVWAVGIAIHQLTVRTTPEAWTNLLSVNLTGMFYVLKSAGPIFHQQQDGSVVIIGSLSSLIGSSGQVAYSASKAALLGLMKTVAREWGPHNIRVNALFPGWQASPLSEPAFPDPTHLGDHVLGRTSSPQEVAKAVYQLAQMKDVSGQIWNLDSRIW